MYQKTKVITSIAVTYTTVSGHVATNTIINISGNKFQTPKIRNIPI